MIVVREVFSIDPDQMKQAKELMRDYQSMVKKLNHPKPRIRPTSWPATTRTPT